MKALWFVFLCALVALMPTCVLAHGQMMQAIVTASAPAGAGSVTLDASCTGAGNATNNPCSSAMTVSAGDTIVVGCYTNGNSFDPSNLVVSDGVNGYYSAVQGNSHPANSNDWITVAVFENSAGGSIKPQCSSWEDNGMGISAYAFKGTRTSAVLDGASSINLFNSASTAATNPTAGTAGAPTNANEAVVCVLDLSSSTATTAGSGYSPTGTLTGVVNTLAQYSQYFINPSTANCPFGTTATRTYTNSQLALLNASNPAGYEGLTGVYGVPAAAQTNGATATAAILNTPAGSLTPLASATAGQPWAFGGTAVNFDTSVAPLGSLKVLTDGVGHVLGDAGASIKFPGSNTSSAFDYLAEGFTSNGNGVWLGSFMRVGTVSGNGNFCDNWNVDGTMTEGNFTTQVYFDTTPGIHFQFERAQGNTPTVTNMLRPALNLNQDYYIITHVAGINEANDELFVLGEATPGTLPWVVMDHFTAPKSGQVISTTTATATSGATSITVASATGIVVGQSVYSATTSFDTGQIPLGDKVTSVAGNVIGIGPTPTTAAMSGTPVEFAGPTASTTGSVTAGGTTLTVASGTGLVAGPSATGQFIGMAGVAPGTWLLSGSGTTWTLSQPAVSTQSSVAAQFWNPDGAGIGMHFGKYSSCVFPADFWYSGVIFDPYGTLLPKIANGSLQL